jgi:hypothetical protein
MLGVVNVVTPVPDDNTDPPVDAAYQSMVSPAPGVADISTVPVEHLVPFVPEGVAGNALTVAVTAVLLAEIQPVVEFLDAA